MIPEASSPGLHCWKIRGARSVDPTMVRHLFTKAVLHIKQEAASQEREDALDKGSVNLLPAAVFSSVILASSSCTRLMFLSLSSATKDTCTDKENDQSNKV